jgi:hypothetical protein
VIGDDRLRVVKERGDVPAQVCASGSHAVEGASAPDRVAGDGTARIGQHGQVEAFLRQRECIRHGKIAALNGSVSRRALGPHETHGLLHVT